MYILASASPRREQLLKLLTEDFKIVPSSVEEILPKNIKKEKIPQYFAEQKATDIGKKFPNDIVIGADTAVFANSKILGKPETANEAKSMLKMLSGKTHKVITGCAVYKNGICKSFSEVTKVKFYKLTDAEIDNYIASGECFDKAGGYGIQSGGGLFVNTIKGDYFNVVGLPIAALSRFLKNNL